MKMSTTEADPETSQVEGVGFWDLKRILAKHKLPTEEENGQAPASSIDPDELRLKRQEKEISKDPSLTSPLPLTTWPYINQEGGKISVVHQTCECKIYCALIKAGRRIDHFFLTKWLINLSQDGTSAFSEISDESQCERAECGS